MHAIDYNPIVKELIRLAKKFYYHLLTISSAENGSILCRIQKHLFAVAWLEDG